MVWTKFLCGTRKAVNEAQLMRERRHSGVITRCYRPASDHKLSLGQPLSETYTLNLWCAQN